MSRRSKLVFQLSGFSNEDRELLAEKLTNLDGIYIDSEYFQPRCTHLICQKPSRSEKFLGACITGKWILVPHFIEESFKCGRWLEEVEFEWTEKWVEMFDPKPPIELCMAALKSRKLQEKMGRKPFETWRAVLLVANKKAKNAYKRLLSLGGAKILDFKQIGQHSQMQLIDVTHVFVEEAMKNLEIPLLQKGFICYPATHIGDIIVKSFIASSLKVEDAENNTVNNVSRENQSSVNLKRAAPSEEERLFLQALHKVKKQKISQMMWHIPGLIYQSANNSPVNQNVVKTMQLPQFYSDLFDICVEEGHMIRALETISSVVSSKYYLSSTTLRTIITQILQYSKDDSVTVKAYLTLEHILNVHPPVSSVMRSVYMEALGFNENSIHSIIRNCIIDCIPMKDKKSHLLLTFIVKLLQLDWMHFLKSSGKSCDDFKKQNRQPMIAQVMWPTSSVGHINVHCQLLFSSVIEAGLVCNTNPKKFTILVLINSLLAMTAECCRLMENFTNSHTIVGKLAEDFARDLAYKLMGQTDWPICRLVLINLTPDWLLMKVCEVILDRLNPDTGSSEEPLSLTKTVTHYFNLSPAHWLFENTQVPSSSSKHSTIKVADSESFKNADKLSCKLNKRNYKGETLLHAVCIKNNVAKLQQLLSVPGIDINARDYVGWTPLHEACNYGHTECVKLLLQYKGQRTIAYYFNKDNQESNKVDLMARGDQGITPLHDAVENNHLEVVSLLLQSGGIKLLEAKTEAGLTPVDLAGSPEMNTLLQSFTNGNTKSELKFSKKNIISKEDACKMLLLLQCMVRSYLQVFSLRHLVHSSKLTRQQLMSLLKDKDFSICKEASNELNSLLKDLQVYLEWDSHVTRLLENLQFYCRDWNINKCNEALILKFLT